VPVADVKDREKAAIRAALEAPEPLVPGLVVTVGEAGIYKMERQ
jgi:hypothetical protein